MKLSPLLRCKPGVLTLRFAVHQQWLLVRPPAGQQNVACLSLRLPHFCLLWLELAVALKMYIYSLWGVAQQHKLPHAYVCTYIKVKDVKTEITNFFPSSQQITFRTHCLSGGLRKQQVYPQYTLLNTSYKRAKCDSPEAKEDKIWTTVDFNLTAVS